MGETEGTYRALQTPGTRLGAQIPAGISTLEPGQTPTLAAAVRTPARLHIRVQLLDDTMEVFDVEPRCGGQALLTHVWRRLSLIECDYFGLEFQSTQAHWIWLEPMKPIVRQIRRPKNTVLRLAVKFFPPDPGQLQEEYTRYLFALQLKRDLLEERLTCTDSTAALLTSHLLQSEIGDYDEELDRAHLRAHEYLPGQERALEKILALHREHAGQTPAESDFQVLEIARKLEMYGIRFHTASDREGAQIKLAVSHTGVLVFQSTTKINTFNWSRLRKLSFKRKRFLVKLHPEAHGPYQDTLEFLLGSRDECKNFWKICVEHHTFFRLSDQPKPKARAVLFSRGSSFRYSGRTQKQLVDYVRVGGVKRTPYERRHSKTRVSLHTLTADLPRQVSEEFIDDDPADISFFAGGSEAFSFPYGSLAPQAPLCSPPGSGLSSPDRSSPEAARRSTELSFEFGREGSPGGDVRPAGASELLEVKAQASLMQRLLSPSETSSLSNAPLHGGLSVHTPSSASQSEASSMANFPACSVRSEASSAFQFSDIIDQLEQVSYPPTTAEASSSSDTDSWGSEPETPPDPCAAVAAVAPALVLHACLLCALGGGQKPGQSCLESHSLAGSPLGPLHRCPRAALTAGPHPRLAAAASPWPVTLLVKVSFSDSGVAFWNSLSVGSDQGPFQQQAQRGPGSGAARVGASAGVTLLLRVGALCRVVPGLCDTRTVRGPRTCVLTCDPSACVFGMVLGVGAGVPEGHRGGIWLFSAACGLRVQARAELASEVPATGCTVGSFGDFHKLVLIVSCLNVIQVSWRQGTAPCVLGLCPCEDPEESSAVWLILEALGLSVESPLPSPSSQKSPPSLSPTSQVPLGPAEQGLSPVLSDTGGAGMDDQEEPRHKCPPEDEAYFIAKEILTTEQTYLKDLEVITVWFRSTLVQEDAMPAELMHLLFSSVDPIYDFHKGFLHEVEQRLALWEASASAPGGRGRCRIGDILRRNMLQLKVCLVSPPVRAPRTPCQGGSTLRAPFPQQGIPTGPTRPAGPQSRVPRRSSAGTRSPRSSVLSGPRAPRPVLFTAASSRGSAPQDGAPIHRPEKVATFSRTKLFSLETLVKSFSLKSKPCSSAALGGYLQTVSSPSLVLAAQQCGPTSPSFRGPAGIPHGCARQSCEELEWVVPGIKTCPTVEGGGLCPPGAGAEEPLCADALQAVTEVTSELQHSLVRLENLQKLTELQRDLVGIENLVAPDREFLREGCLHTLTKQGLQPRMFFLFSDVLLYTSRGASGTSRFRMRGLLPLRGMLVEERQNEWPAPHCFTIYAAQKTVVVAASTQLEKEKWMQDLQAAIDAAKHSSGTALGLPGSMVCALSRRSPDEVSLEQESEDARGAGGPLEGQGRHRANTTVHVCWHRSTSVSRADRSAAVENQLSGYLLRKFKNSSGWQKLWVVLTNFCLFFYKSHQDDYPLASLPLLGYQVSIPREADGIHKEHVFKLQFKSHIYFFRAESKYTFRRWMEVIEKASSCPGRARPLEEEA
uniref:FERM, ARHGEF and pleckstrin domain-containing protein 2 n=1 Tax=Camelus bactrianus TaxID=9837 RepID=A0A9W3FW96_CAMBA|nr:FERM, ARHGEF and pleckstrin domain-containing protein 2 [Camelus bactrianus]